MLKETHLGRHISHPETSSTGGQEKIDMIDVLQDGGSDPLHLIGNHFHPDAFYSRELFVKPLDDGRSTLVHGLVLRNSIRYYRGGESGVGYGQWVREQDTSEDEQSHHVVFVVGGMVVVRVISVVVLVTVSVSVSVVEWIW